MGTVRKNHLWGAKIDDFQYNRLTVNVLERITLHDYGSEYPKYLGDADARKMLHYADPKMLLKLYFLEPILEINQEL